MADKSPQAFRTIREVADWLGVEAHALRFWESKFSQIKPVKRAGGRRYYRPSDMRLIGGIKILLHDQGLTIRGVQKLIREEGAAHVASLSPPLDEDLDAAPDPIIEAMTDDQNQAASGGFVDIETLAGEDPPPKQEVAPPAPETSPDPEPAPEPQAASEPAAAEPQPEPVAHAETTDAEPEPEPAQARPIPETVTTPESPSPSDAPSDAPAPAEPVTPRVAASAAPGPDTHGDSEIRSTPLSELRTLIHGAVPFSLDQRRQLAPMVARLESLAARLDGRGHGG